MRMIMSPSRFFLFLITVGLVGLGVGMIFDNVLQFDIRPRWLSSLLVAAITTVLVAPLYWRVRKTWFKKPLDEGGG
jgi:hypothetical protein